MEPIQILMLRSHNAYRLQKAIELLHLSITFAGITVTADHTDKSTQLLD